MIGGVKRGWGLHVSKEMGDKKRKGGADTPSHTMSCTINLIYIYIYIYILPIANPELLLQKQISKPAILQFLEAQIQQKFVFYCLHLEM